MEPNEVKSGQLSKLEILTRLREPDLKKRLVITPLLDPSQVGGSSVDLRLGFSFIFLRRSDIPKIDPLSANAEEDLEKYQERVTIRRGGSIYLHPGEFALGASIEYVCLPNDLAAYVTSRSSWGRTGLVIATAISVAPGFRGVITLELANLGVTPLALRPGIRVAQIVFSQTQSTVPYTGRYSCPTFPEFGKIYQDAEIPFLRGQES